MRLALLHLAALAAAACAAEPIPERGAVSAALEPPPRPRECRTVRAGEALQPFLDSAPEGSALCLAPGRHQGPITIARRITLFGPREAVIRTSGAGTTVLVTADGARVAGITIDGSGGRYDTQDAAIAVRDAAGVQVEGLRVVNAVFGILAENTTDTLIRGNEVIGDPATLRGMRGDGIRLWETRRSRIEHNLVQHSRDLVVWYSPANTFVGNTVEHSRYGTHFMYSHDNVVEEGVFRSNAVNIFIMYSRNVRVRGADLIDAHGPSGMGIGLKDAGDVEITESRFVHNAMGVYLDTSPLSLEDENRFANNLFTLSDRAIVFHGRGDRNLFTDNAFVSNREQIVVEGRGDALGATFATNRFDDYAGYDLDDDGIGDIPYEVRSLSNQLTGTYPVLAFFAGTPALAIVEVVGRIVPLFAPRTIAVDPRPRMVGGGPTGEER